MSQYDPNLDPTRQPNTPRSEPIYSETIVVRRESNTGWWIAGVLAAAVVLAVIWILASREPTDDTQARLAEAQAAQAVADAQAASNTAVIQGQIAGGQQSVDIARANAVQAQADAIRAASEARTAEARAATPPAPVVITSPPPSNGAAVVTSNSPQ